MKTIDDLDAFTRAYIEALFFTEAGPDSEDITTDSEFSQEALTELAQDCKEFQFSAEGHMVGCSRGGSRYTVQEQAGHDFWLTRNGHGAGFWDGDWPEKHGAVLDRIAKDFGEIWAYLGDDGFIYFAH